MPPAFKMAGLTWSDQETYELIKIWAADRDMLDGTSRNNKVYESMAAQMRTLGYMRTALQVKEKMKRLRKEYKYGKRSKKIATYHEALSSVLSGGPFKPVKIPLSSHPNPPLPRMENDRESLNGSEDYPNTDHEDAEPSGNASQAAPVPDIKLIELNNNNSNEADRHSDIFRQAAALNLLSTQAEQIRQQQAQAVAQLPPVIDFGEKANGLKRKLNDKPLLGNDTVVGLAQSIMDSINKGVCKFMELEERRMRMELDMIERMRKEDMERQERLRREEMHHEVRLMTLIAGLFQQTAKSGETPANLGSLLKELQASATIGSNKSHSESYSDDDGSDDDDFILSKKMRIDESVKTD